jgi:hypothetical protein
MVSLLYNNGSLGMDYVKEYKSFINSHYLSDGLRITAGIVLPALILSYFSLLSIGVSVSLGAMSVSITDTPGPHTAPKKWNDCMYHY